MAMDREPSGNSNRYRYRRSRQQPSQQGNRLLKRPYLPGAAGLLVVMAVAGVFMLPGWLGNGKPAQESSPAVQTVGLPSPSPSATAVVAMSQPVINASGMTIAERFLPPPGFRRVAVQAGSFAEYLRNYPLRPDGTQVQYYDGAVKPNHAYLAVADMDLEGSRLQQCADTVLRLHAEYLYIRGEQSAIGYHFVSGFDFRWDKWRQGYRVKVDGNQVSWVQDGNADDSAQSFKAYLQMLYNYASTLSLEHYDTDPVEPRELAIGDMFLRGGSPGHVVLVVDMAEEPVTGRKCFILLQGFMPAQDAQILRNLEDGSISPWVMLPEEPAGEFHTPEYQFTWDQVKRFK